MEGNIQFVPGPKGEPTATSVILETYRKDK